MTSPAVPTANETLRFFRKRAKSILVALFSEVVDSKQRETRMRETNVLEPN